MNSKKNDKILSISIAAYNSEHYLDKCISSIVGIRNRDKLDVIIVDDGSSDGTGKKAEQYAKAYPQCIRVIKKANGGHGSTINASMKIAEGKYFRLVDADDWVETDNLERLVGFLGECDADMVVMPYYIVEEESGKKRKTEIQFPNNPYGKTDHIDMYSGDFEIQMHEVCYKTEILKNIKMRIDENCFYVDQEFVLFPIRGVFSFCPLDYPVYCYRYGTAEQSCNWDNLIRRRDEFIHVFKRIIVCYSRYEYRDTQKKIMLRRMAGMMGMLYSIFIKMSNEEGQNEYRRFDRGLRKKDFDLYMELYQRLSIKKRVYIMILRNSNYSGYKMICGVRDLLRVKCLKLFSKG